MDTSLNKKIVELQIENNKLREQIFQLQEAKKKKGLIGGQRKLDRNKNGRLDKEDFEMLRGEVSEAKKSTEPKLFSGQTMAQYRAEMDAAANAAAERQAREGITPTKPSKPATVAGPMGIIKPKARKSAGMILARKILSGQSTTGEPAKTEQVQKPLTPAQRKMLGGVSTSVERAVEAGKPGTPAARKFAAGSAATLRGLTATPQGRAALLRAQKIAAKSKK